MSEKSKYVLAALNSNLEALGLPKEPPNLYEPLRYFLNIGGKRIRPVLCMLTYNIFKSDWQKAMPAATAIELFHNFTLLHDDIMDNAPVRRGKQTVHEKWNLPIAILSGDALLVKAYQQFEELDPSYLLKALSEFNKTSLEVCEGQQLDMDFEQYEQVPSEKYLEMIRLKTAVLIGFSMWLGAFIAGEDEKTCTNLYNTGLEAGIGFQIMDDYLDAYGNKEQVGKQVGGDIIARKKTILITLAQDHSNSELIRKLSALLDNQSIEPDLLVTQVKNILSEMGIPETVKGMIKERFSSALKGLSEFSGSKFNSQPVYNLLQGLMVRDF